MDSKTFLIIGNIIWHNGVEIKILKGFLAVENGKIISMGDDWSQFKDFTKIFLEAQQFIIPGFIDCHVHAPQFPNLGLGLDLPLLDWLDKYTFPLEKRYDDVDFARRIYEKVVRRLLKHGTTTACYFGSLSLNGTLELAKIAEKWNQRALVGKVSMNLPNKHGYYNDIGKEIQDVQEFLDTISKMKLKFVEPIITPRFAVSCDFALLKKLGDLAKQYNCRIQSHISENKEEIATVLKLFPDCKSYAEVYDKTGLLTNKTILAHGVHLSDDEIRLLHQRGVSIAHCPASNTRINSGLCPVRYLSDFGIDCGLGTDVSGGDSASILDTMRRTMDVSTHYKLLGKYDTDISWEKAFYMATLGGAKALNLDDKVGSFEVGKEFDALLIDPLADGNIDDWGLENETIQRYLQRFIFTGDDRNIKKVFVKGVEIKF